MAISQEMMLNPKLLERIQKIKEQNASPLNEGNLRDIMKKLDRSEINWETLSQLKLTDIIKKSKSNFPPLLSFYLSKQNHQIYQHEDLLKFEVNKTKIIYLCLSSMFFIGPIRRIEMEGLYQNDFFIYYKDEFDNSYIVFKKGIYKILSN